MSPASSRVYALFCGFRLTIFIIHFPSTLVLLHHFRLIEALHINPTLILLPEHHRRASTEAPNTNLLIDIGS
ncbi:hypothetical protein L2E82_19813 [Cichorium intybus]|uniref:Uncharacterized protein n=1 Tax=Cichorium intybus TaxID=13427 RepID=A0ACB9DRW8_CICIN|nr:hypothetical protein L2E82_19813 [Cichorium intybus]